MKYKDLVKANPALKYDPFIRQEIRREERRAYLHSIRYFSQRPNKSCNIKFLDNAADLNNVGNIRYSVTGHYDIRTNKVDFGKGTTPIPWHDCRLKNGKTPPCWIEI